MDELLEGRETFVCAEDDFFCVLSSVSMGSRVRGRSMWKKLVVMVIGTQAGQGLA